MRTFKLADWKRSSPPPEPPVDVELLEVPLEHRAEVETLTWGELACRATPRVVPHGTRAPKGVIWFRRGTPKDGSLDGRVLTYGVGA